MSYIPFVTFLFVLESLSELKELANLEVLDLSENNFNGSIPIRGSSKLLFIFLSQKNYCSYNIFLFVLSHPWVHIHR